MAPAIDLAGWLAIFRAGTHTDMGGQTQAWTEADLDAIVANYNPTQYQAPIVLGHPQSNDPAWGWVAALKRIGNTLYAQFEQVVPEFADMIRRGLYANRSVAMDYTDSGWWLRHVGFLGAVPPAVRGLNAAAALASPAQTTVAFHEGFEREVLGGLLRRLREFLIARFDMETADTTLPSFDIDLLSRPAPEIIEVPVPMPEPEGSPFMAEPMTLEQVQAQIDAAVQAALAQQQTTLQASFAAREQEREARVAQIENERRFERYNGLVSALVKDGRLTPAQKSLGVVEFLCALEVGGTTVQFADGQGTVQSQAPGAWFEAFLRAMPIQVHFREYAGHRYDEPSTDDPAGAYLTRVHELMRTANVSFSEAEQRVSSLEPALYDAYVLARTERSTVAR